MASTLDATLQLLVWPRERWVVEILSMHQIADGASTLCEERSDLRQGYSQTHGKKQITQLVRGLDKDERKSGKVVSK